MERMGKLNLRVCQLNVNKLNDDLANFTRLVVAPINWISAITKTGLKQGYMVLGIRNPPVHPIASLALILRIFTKTLGKQGSKIIIVKIAIRMFFMPPTCKVAKSLMRLLIANTCQTGIYIKAKNSPSSIPEISSCPISASSNRTAGTSENRRRTAA